MAPELGKPIRRGGGGWGSGCGRDPASRWQDSGMGIRIITPAQVGGPAFPCRTLASRLRGNDEVRLLPRAANTMTVVQRTGSTRGEYPASLPMLYC